MIYFLTILQRYLSIVISPLPVAHVLDRQINSNHGKKFTRKATLPPCLSLMIAVNFFTLVSPS